MATLMRGLRLRQRLSLKALGRRVDASAPHLYNIEVGRKLPSEALAGRIAVELGVDPGVYRAWVRAAGRSDWRMALHATRVLERFLGDRSTSTLLAESGIDPSMVLAQLDRDPAPSPAIPRMTVATAGPARVLVPVLTPGSDPADRPGIGRERTWLRLDPAALATLASLERPFAYALAPDRFPRAGQALPASGFAVLTREPGWPLEPGVIYAVRLADRVDLAPALWNGTMLLVPAASGRSDFMTFPAEPESLRRDLLRGRVVLIAD